MQVAGHEYSVGRLSARQQFHLVRRLLPAFQALGDGVSKLVKAGLDTDLSALEPLARVVAAMPDNDVDYVLNLCLGVVQRQEGPSWARVLAPNGQMMYQDIQMPEMLQLTLAVLRENLSSFFPVPPAAPPGATQTG